MQTLQVLDTHLIDDIHFSQSYPIVNYDSNARYILTDFTKNKPLVISSTLPAIEAEHLMKKSHVRFKLVVDSYNKWVGTISLKELSEEFIIKKVSEGETRHSIVIADLMTPKSSTLCLKLDTLSSLNIRQFIYSIKDYDITHCVVADQNELCGIISASHIAKRLKIDTHSTEHITFKYLYNLYNANP